MAQPILTELPDLFVLPLPTPFPIGRINTYVDRSDGLTLIDTGVNSPLAYEELVQGLATLGCTPSDLDRIIITHHHTDHIGLTERLAETSGAEVWCHELCTPYMENPVDARQNLCRWSMRIWQEGGVPESLLDTTERLFEWFASLSNGPVPVSRILRDCDRITLAGQYWDVLHTPGHAGDLICLYLPSSRILLSSDHLLRDVSSNALAEPPVSGGKRPHRLIEYMSQLQRIADMNPRIAYGGHGNPTEDVPGLVAQRLLFHQKRAEHILSLFDTEPHTLFSITESMFGHVSEPEKFLALSEVLGHLDWLERDGHIVRIPGGDIVRWHTTRL
jgi:glyoxylase-like metal-dependent hydrolase (beta-lactamase superfamily II)